MNRKRASARVLPILGFQTIPEPENRTLREILKDLLGLDFYNVPSSAIELFPGRNVIGVEPDDLTGELVLVRLDSELAVMTRDEAEKAARRKGLRLVGVDEPPEIELLGSIAFSRTCYSTKHCSRCQLCDFGLGGEEKRSV